MRPRLLRVFLARSKTLLRRGRRELQRVMHDRMPRRFSFRSTVNRSLPVVELVILQDGSEDACSYACLSRLSNEDEP